MFVLVQFEFEHPVQPLGVIWRNIKGVYLHKRFSQEAFVLTKFNFLSSNTFQISKKNFLLNLKVRFLKNLPLWIQWWQFLYLSFPWYFDEFYQFLDLFYFGWHSQLIQWQFCKAIVPKKRPQRPRKKLTFVLNFFPFFCLHVQAFFYELMK